MDIKKINEENEPGYPTLNDHLINRRNAIRTIVGGLAVAGLVGCKKEEPPRISGEMCQPTPPETQEPPQNKHPETLGEMPAPVKPEHPQVDGDMPMPVQPEQPRKRGRIMVPQPQPSPEDRPPAKGKIVAPKPPKK